MNQYKKKETIKSPKVDASDFFNQFMLLNNIFQDQVSYTFD